jgi:tetratricopeptide (TPR) repeat protein
MKKNLFIICILCCLMFVMLGRTAKAQSWEELRNLASIQYYAGKMDSAIIYEEKALIMGEKEFGENSYQSVLSVADLGLYYYKIGEFDKAKLRLLETIIICKEELGEKHPSYVTSLSNLADVYKSTANYTKAEPLYIETIALRKKILGEEHSDYALSLDNLAALYRIMGKNSEAVPLFLEAIDIWRRTKRVEHISYATSVNDLAFLYQSINKFDEAEPLYLEAITIWKKKLGKEHPNYVTSLSNLAKLYVSMGNYERAILLYKEEISIRKKTLGVEHPDYTLTLINLAKLYESINNYALAANSYTELLAIWKRTLGVEHPNYEYQLDNLAGLYHSIGSYAEAEQLNMEVVAIRKKTLGVEHPDYALSLSNLAGLYHSIGSYEQAERFYTDAIGIQKKALGEYHPEYATSLNNLAGLYEDMGRYEQAERFYTEAIGIRKKALGDDDPEYAKSLNNLAALYHSIGSYEQAERLYNEAIVIKKKGLGEEHPNYATSLNNLAALYSTMGSYKRAEPLYIETIGIWKKTFGDEHPNYATSLNNLAELYLNMGSYGQAEPLYLEAIGILKKTFGDEHPNYATLLNNLAGLYSAKGSYKRAELLYIEAEGIWKKSFGEEHPNFATSINNLAGLYKSMGNYTKAEPLYLEANKILLKNISKSFSFLSETEKEKYLKTVLFNLESFHSFSKLYQSQKPAISSEAYNIEIAIKGMVLLEGINMRHAILGSGNQEAIAVFNKWNNHKSSLARLYSLPIAERKMNTDSLEVLANNEEKELARLSATFRESKLVSQATWENVQNALDANQVAIEFASFKFLDGKRWTDTTYYTALVLRKGDAYPTMVNLCRQDQLDSLLNNIVEKDDDYLSSLYRGVKARSSVVSKAKGEELYKLIWKPLESLLKPGEQVYFAPSGSLHQVAFAAIPLPDSTTLSDRYRLTQLSSTAMLLQSPENKERRDLSLAAFGGISYDAAPTELMQLTTKGKQTQNVVASRSLLPDGNRGTSWNYLPGTLEEINNIATLAKKHQVNITVHSGASALEETYKSYGSGTSPNIIHIATHGFFFPDPAKEYDANKGIRSTEKQVFRTSDNPLNRAGLLFAGANHIWKEETLPPGLEDGILTAYEASHVSITNTELVVLSACETGLGEIKGSEGVFGLQRGFKAAGATYLLMSLWKVPDAETAEFMTAFYSALFSENSVEDAFVTSQTVMKNKYRSNPYKWAAFVLVR